MTQNANSLHSYFRIRYLAGLMLLAFLACASVFIFVDQSQKQRGHAELINLASTQKALSQRIAFYANKFVASDDVSVRQQLATETLAATAQMRQAHDRLSGAIGAHRASQKLLENTRAIYFNEYSPFNDDVNRFLASAENLVSLNAAAQGKRASTLKRLTSSARTPSCKLMA